MLEKLNKINLLKLSIITIALTGGQFAQADSSSPPETCKEGRQSVKLWGGNHYLEWSGINKYVLLDKDYTNTAKIDTHYDPTSDKTYLNFYSSVDGFLEEKSVSPLHQHATKSYNFSERGSHKIWVTSYDNGWEFCAYNGINAQLPPSVSTTKSQTIEPTRTSGTLYFSGWQDNYYSKNAIEFLPIQYEVQRKIISKWTGQFCDVVEESTSWETARQLSSSNSMSFSNIDCHISYRIRSFDGTYYSNWDLESVIYNPNGSGGGSGSGTGGGGASGGGTCTGNRCSEEP